MDFIFVILASGADLTHWRIRTPGAICNSFLGPMAEGIALELHLRVQFEKFSMCPFGFGLIHGAILNKCHFEIRGKFSSLGDSNHWRLLQLLFRPHDGAVCLGATPALAIIEIFSVSICFSAHTTAEFKHSSTGVRTWNPSVGKREQPPLCHHRCSQSVVERL